MLQLGIMLHSLVIGLTLSITAGPEFGASAPGPASLHVLTPLCPLATLVTAILFHQLFEGLSLGVRIAALPAGGPRALRPALVVLFALTTPLGMAAGLLALGGADRASWNTSDADADATTERRAQSLVRANIVHERETDDSCLAWVHV